MRFAAGIFGACLIALGTQTGNAQSNNSLGYTGYTAVTPGGIKVCSALVPNNWRNDLPVPRSWTQATCQAWAGHIGAGAAQAELGCLTDSGMLYNFQGGAWNTCGW